MELRETCACCHLTRRYFLGFDHRFSSANSLIARVEDVIARFTGAAGLAITTHGSHGSQDVNSSSGTLVRPRCETGDRFAYLLDHGHVKLESLESLFSRISLCPAVPIGSVVGATSTSGLAKMSGEDEASIRYYGILKSMGDTYGFIKCRRTQHLYTRDVYITKSDLPDGGEVSKPVSFQVVLNERGRPQAREVRVEDTVPEESEDEQPEELQKAHSAPLPSTSSAKSPPSSSPPRSLELKPLSAPIAPWADIVDDEDFEPLEARIPNISVGGICCPGMQ
eukprot:Skav222331  [mRNA]  locus=scaffold1249:388433:396573:- [translate_table: standard]